MGSTVINGERDMVRFHGSLARTLDFDEPTVPSQATRRLASAASGLRPYRRRLGLRAPDKYKVLDQRRRAAQIAARHALDLIELMEHASEGK